MSRRDSDDSSRSGLATRAIQESYLSMEQAHRQFRVARDEGDDTDEPQAMYQDAVLTFYELLRPYLKGESQLSGYWNGEIPGYPSRFHQSVDEAMQYYQDHSIGVYQMQNHVSQAPMNQQVLTDGGSDTPQAPVQWHQLLGRPSTSRIVSVQPEGDLWFFRELRFAVLGLRELDYWKAEVVTERGQGDGFMAGETNISKRLEYESPQKITTAKRMLTEAANKLGALPDYHIEDTRDAGFDYSDLLDGGAHGEHQ